MARVWLSAGAYYADLDPAHFQVDALVVHRAVWRQGIGGHERGSILFQKALS
jgi:hypothetical protein